MSDMRVRVDLNDVRDGLMSATVSEPVSIGVDVTIYEPEDGVEADGIVMACEPWVVREGYLLSILVDADSYRGITGSEDDE